MNKEISFYELDLLSKIGIAGGWIAFVLFILSFITWMGLKLMGLI